MANVKKADLSTDQQDDINLFKSELSQRGWEPTGTFGALFEQGWAVPYQAEFARKKDGTSLIARYVCGRENGQNMINVTLHTAQDNQMVAFQFDRLSPRALAALVQALERLPQSTVRRVLEDIAARDLEVAVNIYDNYVPLNANSLQRIYRSDQQEQLS